MSLTYRKRTLYLFILPILIIGCLSSKPTNGLSPMGQFEDASITAMANKTMSSIDAPTASSEPLPKVFATITPTSQKRTISYPSKASTPLPDFKVDCDNQNSTYATTFCAYLEAYKSARELDALLKDLDQQFPNGGWENAFQRLILPQEKWESYKEPYCEIAEQESVGGTAHSALLLACINEQNLDRIERLKWAACLESNFSQCPPVRESHEPWVITTQPILAP
jgi:hypothetical protein